MASTYVNDLRLEEMATGDQSGTWGDTTNTNLELIAEAFSYGTEASFSSDADATTTIADGATDPARSLYLKVTSGASLTATRTLTIAPNTVSKVWIIENATSGSQSINISQGSGANVTIPNGDVKVVYSDGAGSGAAVVDAFTSLNVGNLTATVADNSDNLTLISTDADAVSGPNVNFYRNSGSPADNDHLGEIRFTGRNDNSQDVVYANIETRIKDASDGTEDGYFDFETMVAGTLQSRLIMNETTTVFNEDSLDLDFRVESNGKDNMLFVDAGNDRVGVGTNAPDYLLHASDSGDTIIAATGGASSIAGLNLGNSTNKADGGIRYDNSADALIFRASNAEKMRLTSTGLGIGVSPSAKLEVQDANGVSLKFGDLASYPNNVVPCFIGTGTSALAGVNGDLVLVPRTSDAGKILFATGNGGAATEKVRIANDGKVGIGTTSPNRKLHLYESTAATSNFIQMTTVGTGETGSNGLLVGISSAGQAEIWNYEAQPTVFATSGSEKLRIDSSGNILAGKTSSTGVATGNIEVSNASSASVQIEGGTNEWSMLVSSSADALRFYQDSTERMRIDSSGNLLVGKTSTTFSVDGFIARNNGFSTSRTSGTVADINRNGTDGNVFAFYKAASSVGSISVTSSATSYNTSSDYRLKENVEYNFNALERVAQLKPARFNFLNDADTTVDGFLAHEVQDIVPEAITGEKDAVDDEGNPEYQGIDQSKLVPLLTKAIQEQQAQIDALQSEINLLKGE